MEADTRSSYSGKGRRRRLFSKVRQFRFLYKIIDAIGNVFELIMVLLGPILALVAECLIWTVVYVFFSDVYRPLVKRHGDVRANLLTLIGLWLATNIAANHLGCLIVGPGFAPFNKGEYTSEHLSSFTLDPEVGEGKSGPRSCRTCKTVKPWRTHHCQICKRCILRMDHHCPWMNRCVGYYNYCYFFLFLVYLWCGTLFFMCNAWFAAVFIRIRKDGKLALVLILVMAIYIAMCIFLILHLYLLLTNQTTIETFGSSQKYRRVKLKRLYSLGSARQNILQVFGGEMWYMWLIPVFWRRRIIPNEPGFVYPVRPEVKATISALDRLLAVEV